MSAACDFEQYIDDELTIKACKGMTSGEIPVDPAMTYRQTLLDMSGRESLAFDEIQAEYIARMEEKLKAYFPNAQQIDYDPICDYANKSLRVVQLDIESGDGFGENITWVAAAQDIPEMTRRACEANGFDYAQDIAEELLQTARDKKSFEMKEEETGTTFKGSFFQTHITPKVESVARAAKKMFQTAAIATVMFMAAMPNTAMATPTADIDSGHRIEAQMDAQDMQKQLRQEAIERRDSSPFAHIAKTKASLILGDRDLHAGKELQGKWAKNAAKMDVLRDAKDDPALHAAKYAHTGGRMGYNDFQKMIQGKTPVQKLSYVNMLWNGSQKQLYKSDKSVYGENDHWASPSEFEQHKGGDCEDFAIAKYGMLRDMGYSAEDMRILIVKINKTNEIHAILAVNEGGKTYILDNYDTSMKTVQQVQGKYTVMQSVNENTYWAHGPENSIKSVAQNKTTEKPSATASSAGAPSVQSMAMH